MPQARSMLPWRHASKLRRSVPTCPPTLRPLRRCTTDARKIEALIERQRQAPLRDNFGTPFAVRSKALLPLSVVESSRVKRSLPVVGNMAYLSIASGFLMTDILALRVLLVGGYTGLVSYHLFQRAPLRIPLFWSAVFAAINAAYAAALAADRWPPGLTDEDVTLRDEHFDRLTRAQFKTLVDLGRRRTLADGEELTVEREVGRPLFFVERGTATLTYNGNRVASIGRGGFVNDVAFQQGPGAGAYGTVTCRGEVSVLEWDAAALRTLLAADAKMRDAVKHVLVSSLVEQLLQRYKADEQQTQQAQQAQQAGGGPAAAAAVAADAAAVQGVTTHSGKGGGARLSRTTDPSGAVFRDSLEQARDRNRVETALRRSASHQGSVAEPDAAPTPEEPPPPPPAAGAVQGA